MRAKSWPFCERVRSKHPNTTTTWRRRDEVDERERACLASPSSRSSPAGRELGRESSGRAAGASEGEGLAAGVPAQDAHRGGGTGGGGYGPGRRGRSSSTLGCA